MSIFDDIISAISPGQIDRKGLNNKLTLFRERIPLSLSVLYVGCVDGQRIDVRYVYDNRDELASSLMSSRSDPTDVPRSSKCYRICIPSYLPEDGQSPWCRQ